MAETFTAEIPANAIDWLSKSVDASESNPIEFHGSISSSRLGKLNKDAVGLLPSEVTGLPPDLWAGSRSVKLESLISRQSSNTNPAALGLLYSLLLAESDPPYDSSGNSKLLLARVDKLLDLGALEQAEALLVRAGPTEPDIFRRWFDIGLLTRTEHRGCSTILASASLAPTYSARIFCLVRQGDWNAASLTLAAARAVGAIEPVEAESIEFFLYPELADDEGVFLPARLLTPLVFRMHESFGHPQTVESLPLAFEFQNLSESNGWKTRIDAAERLARTQAISPERLFSIYSEHPPAASGGAWERVRLVQALDLALLSGDLKRAEQVLPDALAAMREVGLAVSFSRVFGPRVGRLPLVGISREAQLNTSLLSGDFETLSRSFVPQNPREKFLLGLATGDLNRAVAHSAIEQAIADAFAARIPALGSSQSVEDGKVGEEILVALRLIGDGRYVDPAVVRDSISRLRLVGLEREARKIAVQLIVLAENN